MDPDEASPSDGRFETFDANDRFVVIRDEDGYGVWRLDDLEEGDPIERFPDDDEGYERAAERWKEVTKADRRHRSPWLRVLMFAVLGALLFWAASSAIVMGMSLFGEHPVYPGDPTSGGFAQTMYLVSAVSFDGWISLAVAYVILWLEGRRDR